MKLGPPVPRSLRARLIRLALRTIFLGGRMKLGPPVPRSLRARLIRLALRSPANRIVSSRAAPSPIAARGSSFASRRATGWW